MARSSVLLLIVVVLAALAASGPGDAAEARGCQTEALATSVALFCAIRRPTVPCCQTLAHSVRVGGAACLRRLAAAPPLVTAALNAHDLLSLYAACAAPAPAYGGGAAPAPALAPAPRYDGGSGADDATAAAVGAADGPSCAPGTLALQMGLFCNRSGKEPLAWPWPPCCEAVVAAVGMGAGDPKCFCRAAQGSGFGVHGVVGLYAACGGLRTGLASHLAKTCPKA
ncbi:hypothetical protein EJB05_50184, partial [Eragrostis curvula]